MTDIWNEKPVRLSSETMLVFEGRKYSWEYQLKIEYDKLKEKAEKWDAAVKGMPILENTLNLDITVFLKLLVEDYNSTGEKLEAIENKVREWDETHTRDRHAAPSILEDLEKILEVSKNQEERHDGDWKNWMSKK